LLTPLPWWRCLADRDPPATRAASLDQRRGEIDAGRGLADPALLIGDWRTFTHDTVLVIGSILP